MTIKRTLALILAALMLLTAFIAIPANAETSGDRQYTVDGDGKLNSRDVVALMKLVLTRV